MGECGIAAADAQHGAAVRYATDACDRGGSGRRVPGDRIGDAGAQAYPRRDGGRQGEGDIGVAGEILRIHHQHAVPAGRLEFLRHAPRAARRCDLSGPQLHACSLPGLQAGETGMN